MGRLLYLLGFVALFSISAVVDAPLVANPEDPAPAPGFTVPAAAQVAGQALRARLELLNADYNRAKQRLESGSLSDPSGLQAQVDRLRKNQALELLVGAKPTDMGAWRRLYAQYSEAQNTDDALGAAWNLLQLSTVQGSRAEALQKMVDAYVAREDIDTALNLAAMAVQANPTAETRRAYAAVLGRFRLTVTDTELDNERDLPRVCLKLSRPLGAQQPIALADLVSVTPGSDVHVTASGSSVCVSGLNHGGKYNIQLHPGLVTADGRTLDMLVQQRVVIPDRTARVQFSSNAYVLARSGRGLLPVRTVNLKEVPLRLYRIPERNAVPVLLSDLTGADLSGWDRQRLQNELGELVWKGVLEVRNERNREVVTNIAIGELIDTLTDGADGKSGVGPGLGIYALSAPLKNDDADNSDDDEEDWRSAATQWLVISNIGIGTLSALDGLHVFTRALDTAQAAGGITVRLLARNNGVLAEGRTDSSGYVRFAPALLQGKGGNAPVMLTAEARGDFNYVSFTGAALDLSERGAEGRPIPGAVDGWLYTDRGIYRPGETIHLSALLRDPRAKARPDVPVRVRVTRPGDIVVAEFNPRTDDLGSFSIDVPTSDAAVTGQWRARAYIDPEGPPVASVDFMVEDFVPPRLEVTVNAGNKSAVAEPGTKTSVAVAARYYYGAPGANLTASGKARIEIDPTPFPALKQYSFDRVDAEYRPVALDLPPVQTDAAGRANLELALPALIDRQHPLRASVLASVFDVSGRPVVTRVSLPIKLHTRYVGIQPLFKDDGIAANEAARFNVVAVDATGRPQANASLRVEWVREEVDYTWFNSNGQWNYREQITEFPAGIDDVRTGANGTAPAQRTSTDGRYRLDVYDRQGNATASYRFHAGWWHAGTAANVPDALTVTVANANVAAGEPIRAFVRAPFAGRAQLLIANEQVFERLEIDLPAAGRQVEIKARREWSPGAYLLVTAWRPELGKPSPQPARAMGLAWIAIGQDERKLNVSIKAPAITTPRQHLNVPVSVTFANGANTSGQKAAGQKIGLTLAAVDEGVLALTRFASPNPVVWFLGQRLFYPDARDLYGQLIAPAEAATGALRAGGDFNTENLAGLDRRSSKVIALFHRTVQLDANGQAQVPLDLPDWNGRLRLMAVAYSADRVGNAEAAMTVRDPVATDLLLPRFLAPGDRATATIDVRNPDTKPQTVRISLTADGSVQAAFPANSFTLAPGAARQFSVPLTAGAPGTAQFRLIAQVGAGAGQALRRDFDLSVRAVVPFSTERVNKVLAPGATEQFSAEQLSAFQPARLRTTLMIASGPAIDSAALIEELVAYPYGCTEQTLSAALPQLFADRSNVVAANHVRVAIARVLSRQRSNGSFGAWTSLGEDTPWLSAYAYDVLTRARSKGFDVPASALDLAADYLRKEMSTREDQRAAAYAAYVLARESAIKPAEARRYALSHARSTSTRLELAHIAAALGAIGENAQAQQLFNQAVRSTRGAGSFDDYGSDLRDTAAMLLLLAESSNSGALATTLADVVDETYARSTYLSTQEQAWLSVAAAQLKAAAAPLRARVGGQPIAAIAADKPQRLQLQPTPAQLLAGYSVQNTGSAPIRLQLAVRGSLRAPPPPESDGYSIARSYHDPSTGAVIDARTMRQGQLVLVVIQGASTRDAALQKVLIADLLPAGLEIENANLDGAGELGLVPVIGRATNADFVSARDDRFVAALTLGARARFQLAYMARAVTPGQYSAPGLLIEDMVAPRFRARTGATAITVLAPSAASGGH